MKDARETTIENLASVMPKTNTKRERGLTYSNATHEELLEQIYARDKLLIDGEFIILDLLRNAAFHGDINLCDPHDPYKAFVMEYVRKVAVTLSPDDSSEMPDA